MSGLGRISHRDISSEIVRRIAERLWEPGALIPGEQALAAEFGCSRATVNRALQDLARSGILERRRKAGTRVSLNPVREARFVIPLVRQEIEAKGAAYGYRLLGCEPVTPDEELRARLGFGKPARMLHVRCLHLADGAPYQYEDRWINLDAVPAAERRFELTQEDFSAAMAQLNSYVDINEESLTELLELAKQHAERDVIHPQAVLPGQSYSNGRLGNAWSVREVRELLPAQAGGQAVVNYRVVAGDGCGHFGSCPQEEFRQWAHYAVRLENGRWVK